MIKIAHEAPISVFSDVQNVTDIDYALVHLFEENEKYFKMFQKAVKQGREVILDNSIFELGKAFDSERYVYWINKLKPTWYIVPDVLESSKLTRVKMSGWNIDHAPNITCDAKKIGVVQGKYYKDLVECAKYMEEEADVDMVAISFDYSYYLRVSPNPNPLISYAIGRPGLIGRLQQDAGLTKPLHLLGASLPMEFWFSRQIEQVYSIDTSNPIVPAVVGEKYDPFVRTTKSTAKLYTLIDTPKKKVDVGELTKNITSFRSIVNPQ